MWLFGLEVVGPGHQGREHRDVEGSPGAWAQALVRLLTDRREEMNSTAWETYVVGGIVYPQ